MHTKVVRPELNNYHFDLLLSHAHPERGHSIWCFFRILLALFCGLNQKYNSGWNGVDVTITVCSH